MNLSRHLHHQIGNDDLKEMVMMRQQGFKLKEIGDQFGLTKAQVHRILSPLGLGKVPEQVRFWRNVQPQSNGCWEWVGCTHNGYGRFKQGDTLWMAHRYAYEWLVHPLDYHDELHHLCYRKSCVNPEHMRVMTRSEHAKAEASCPPGSKCKLVCINGHDITPSSGNRITHSNGAQSGCRICQRRRNRKHMRRERTSVREAH